MGDDGLPIGERGDGIVRSEPILRSARGAERVNELRARFGRRRERIVAEIERNRRGDYRVPTWVLALVLAAMVAAIIAFVLLG